MKQTTRQLCPKLLMSATARVFETSSDMLIRPTRVSVIVIPRQVGMLIMHRYLAWTLKDTAKFWGRRNHTTVIHACQSVECSYALSREFRQKVDALLLELGIRPEERTTIGLRTNEKKQFSTYVMQQ